MVHERLVCETCHRPTRHGKGKRILMLLLYLAAVLAVGAFFALGRLVNGAPMPLPRPLPPKVITRVASIVPSDLHGDWELTWDGGQWKMTLSAFGTYRCWVDGGAGEWQGTWVLDGLGRLVVEERSISPDSVGEPWSWYVLWDKDKSGLLDRREPTGAAHWSDNDNLAAHLKMTRKKR